MPELIDPRGQDNPSTYFVADRKNDAEMIRLLIQDQLVTAGMGGPLAEQPDPASPHHILDLGCGPGGWVLETAARYPHMSLVGIDISWRMIEYAHAQAQAQKLTDGVEFRIMDALRTLGFPDASFGQRASSTAIPKRFRLECLNSRILAAIQLGELEEAIACIEGGQQGAKTLESKQRSAEVDYAYQLMCKQWPREERVKKLRGQTIS